MIKKQENIWFIGLLIFHIGFLIYASTTFSISYKEAEIYFHQHNLLSYITHFSTSIFGQNDIALRLPFIFFYACSAIVLYLLTDDYFKKPYDRFIAIFIFTLLPGLNSAALLVNESIIVVFFTLLYLYIYKLKQKECYLLLVLFLFIDNSFAILYLALFFYSLKKKDNILLIVSLSLFGISMSMFGFHVGGHPKGYLIDTFGIYASIFSPLLFLYFFFSLYRVGLKWEKDMYWYISMTALGLSLLLSLRQKINLADFAPFVVISIPIMVKLFLHSYRVRLPQFRKKHTIGIWIVLGILVINYFSFIYNKYLYIFFSDKTNHFAYKYHIAKELAFKLKSQHITSISTDDKKMQLRLKFYGISYGKQFYITSHYVDSYDKLLTINYYGEDVAKYKLIKLN